MLGRPELALRSNWLTTLAGSRGRRRAVVRGRATCSVPSTPGAWYAVAMWVIADHGQQAEWASLSGDIAAFGPARAAKRRAGAPGVAPRCPPARSWGSARSRRSRWRDRACRRASAQGGEGHRARARRRSRHENPHSRLRQEYSRPAQNNVEPAPWGVHGRESATSAHARTGARVVDSRYLPVGLGLGCGADSDGSPFVSSADDPRCSLSLPVGSGPHIAVGFLADAASDACGLTTLGCRGVP